ncbi:MAG: branched-chain-amino-acid transaminase [Firmicutes bacterium]|nr:branched-chain-amino-acid transaminase [Bacillota bacterium]
MSHEIYLNGSFVPSEEAKISVFDHGLLYGDGIFEGIRAYNGFVFRLHEHIQRLIQSAQSIALAFPWSADDLEEIVVQTIRRNGLRDAYVRLVITRGIGDLGLDPRNCAEPEIFCIADQIQLYPPAMYENGLRVVTTGVRRNAADALNPRVKSLNYLNNILAKIQANDAGAGEGLMLNEQGLVAEATGDNLFIVQKGRVCTPPASMGALEGITRNAVLDLCRLYEIPVAEVPITLHEVYVADECFLTGTAAELIAVTQIDGRVIGSGKEGLLTHRLHEGFRQLVQKEGRPVYDE